MSASLVGSEMCIRDSSWLDQPELGPALGRDLQGNLGHDERAVLRECCVCLLYTSDAADDM
eukprot:2944841-Alexandrium_andersonii.AAC.1